MLKETDLPQENPQDSNEVVRVIEDLEKDRSWFRFAVAGVGVSLVLNLILAVMLIINWNRSPQVIIRYQNEKEGNI